METEPPKRTVRVKDLKKRTIVPRGEASRKFFTQIYDYLLRYSVSPTEKDDYGQYLMQQEEAAKFLRMEIEELKNLDGMISHEYFRRTEDLESPGLDYRVGVYRVVWPKTKQLNDAYLGIMTTNEFMKELNEQINNFFHGTGFHFLRKSYKGGAFLMDFSFLSQEEILEEIFVIQDIATEKLRKFALEKLGLQEDNLTSVQRLLEAYDNGELEIKNGITLSEEGNEIIVTEKAIKEYRSQPKTLEKHIADLKDLLKKLDPNNESSAKVKISFGFDDMREGMEGSFESIRNAEIAAIMGSLNVAPPEKLMFFSNINILLEAINAMHMLQDIVTENGIILKEWEDFFMYGETNRLQMVPTMIDKYRKLERHRTTEEYKKMTAEQRESFENKISFFGQYYERMNIVDVLKPFREDSYGAYQQKVSVIVDLIMRAEGELAKIQRFAPDHEAIRACLEDTSEVLELSLKDEGEEIALTTRAVIKSLLEDGDKLLAFCDNIGLGGKNQASYEISLINLVKMMDFTSSEWLRAAVKGEDQEKLVEEKLAAIEESDEFKREFLIIGDSCTAKIRKNESVLHSAFGGKGRIDSEGGDETNCVWLQKENPNLPDDEESIRTRLLDLAKGCNLRIAAVLTNFKLQKIRGWNERAAITEKQRSQITPLINIYNWVGSDHVKSKAVEDLGYRRIGFKIVK